MKAGDILLFKEGKDLYSRLTSRCTGSRYSHVAICIWPEKNLAIEAIMGGGVRARDIRAIRQEYDLYRVKKPFKYDLEGAISYLVSKLNERYDYTGVLFLGIVRLLVQIGLPLEKVSNTWQKPTDYFCSELCYEAFHKGGGLDIVPEVPEASITSPGDIAASSVLEAIGRGYEKRRA